MTDVPGRFTSTEVTAENGLVTGGHPMEAAAGVDVLRAGGNAIDALVAAAFTGFVMEPSSCGIGGYGHLTVFQAATGRYTAIDHYVRAPGAARAEMFDIDPDRPMKYYGFPHTRGLAAEVGHLSPAVPGAVAGLCEAHARFGRLPLARVLEPAIGAAEAGVPVTWALLLVIADRLDDIRARPAIADFLLRDGKLPKTEGQVSRGDRLDTRDLAGALKRIAAEGPNGFYRGAVAEAIVREVAAGGGVLTLDDLASYRPRVIDETPSGYRDLTFATGYDQVGIEALNILETFDLPSFGEDSVTYRHVMAEALAAAFVDSMTHYGDPAFERSPVEGLSSKGFAAARAAGIKLDRAMARPVAPADPWPWEPSPSSDRQSRDPGFPPLAGTSQMTAIDREGNVASLITSLTSSFGSLVLVPGAGVILNNSMQNFDPRPDRMNRIRPNKMPIFAAPALVAARDGRPAFAGAGSGGYRITSGVLHGFVNWIDHGMNAQSAVDAPRVHCQGDATYTDARIDPSVQERLAELGHDVTVQQDSPGLNAFGRVNAIAVDSKTGSFTAGVWPPWATAAAGY